MQDELPNNPLKLPFNAIVVCFSAVLVVVCAADGLWPLVPLLAIAIALSLNSIRVIRQGRNPRWMRAPLDRWWQRRLRSGAEQ